MLSKPYESIEVDHRPWPHVPSGLSGAPAVTLIKWLKNENENLLRCIHHLNRI